MSTKRKNLIWFEELSRGDVGVVGGKNASLGEMVQSLSAKGIRVPPGFATTADAFRAFLTTNALDEVIAERLRALKEDRISLHAAGSEIRAAIAAGRWPEDIRDDILGAYRELAVRAGHSDPAVAVRSSATAEDLPDASFAGQQETFLNVRGEADLLGSVYRRSLEVADEHGLKTISFPSISTGAYGFPVEEAANVGLKTVRDYLQGRSGITEVTFVLFSDQDMAAYCKALEMLIS